MYHTPPPPIPPSSSSSYSPPPEPAAADDISFLLRQILFKSSSSSPPFSQMKSRDEIHHHHQQQQQQQQPSAVAAPPPPNLMAHVQQLQASSSVDYDPDSESEEGFEHLMEEMVAKPNPNPPRNPSKRARAAEVHNMSEKRRRSRINEKMKALQKLIPNSNKTDKASMLDEAIEYLKQLQLQVQMLTMRNGINLYSIYQPNQRASGMNYVNPMLNQSQTSILDFSPAINQQDPSFGTQLRSS